MALSSVSASAAAAAAAPAHCSLQLATLPVRSPSTIPRTTTLHLPSWCPHPSPLLSALLVVDGGRRNPSRHRAFSAASALPNDAPLWMMSEDFPLVLTSGIALANLIGFGIFRAFVYFRIQYIIAAMLGKYVPRGGSRVLDLDIHEGRNLYYYPSDVEEVIAITDKKNYEVVKNQAVRAGVPTDVKLKAIKPLSLPANSIDAVVSVYCLCGVDDKQAKTILREALKLLKPGKPFIFVENVRADGEFLQACQMLLHKLLKFVRIENNIVRDVAKYLEDIEGLEKLQYETLFNFQDPHIVGVAFKCIELTDDSGKKRRNRRSISS